MSIIFITVEAGGKRQAMLRHEIKYVLTEAQALLLASRIRGLLRPDPYMPSPDGYIVSSLYFDDRADSSYHEKLAGAEHRKKYRVRLYNFDPSFIVLERKVKVGGMIEKHSTPISRPTFERLDAGDFGVLEAESSELAHQVLACARARGLAPKVVVTYRREAYIHPVSNTRITFDKQLDAAWSRERMTGGGDFAFAFPSPGTGESGSVVMEIKYDRYLPAFISAALSHSGPPLAASKYVICRDKLAQLKKYYSC
jgi:hypothetical protein